MAAQHAGEAVPMLRLGRADRDRAGHVGGAVQVLPAGVDEVERARLQRAVRLRRHPVVDDGTVGAGARNGVEAGAAEVLAAGTHRRQTADGIQLGDGAGRGGREPGQEAGQRRTVPAMGRTNAGKLDLVLARLGQRTGIGAANYLGAALRQAIDHPDRRRRLVDQHCLACLRQAHRARPPARPTTAPAPYCQDEPGLRAGACGGLRTSRHRPRHERWRRNGGGGCWRRRRPAR